MPDECPVRALSSIDRHHPDFLSSRIASIATWVTERESRVLMRTSKLALAATSAILGGAALFATPTTAGATALAPCRIVADTHGGSLRLWYCDGTGGTRNGYHGQAVGAFEGDQLFLRSAAGTKTAVVNIPRNGNYDTATVGSQGGPWKACYDPWPTAPGVGDEFCTAAGW